MEAHFKTIETLEHRIRELEAARDVLVREFGLNRRTRKDIIVDFLQTNGPTSAHDLSEQTQTPRGTIGVLLTDKDTFVRSEDGKWDLVPVKKLAPLTLAGGGAKLASLIDAQKEN